VKQLKELQQAMKAGATAIDVDQVKPLLARAIDLIRAEALVNLQSGAVRLGGRLPLAKKFPDAKHIEDVLKTSEGKSTRIATAWTKVLSKFAPQAIWIETGHKIVGHKPHLTDTGKMVSPRPFFRPAVMSKRTAVRKTIRVGLQELLSKAFGFGKPGDATE